MATILLVDDDDLVSATVRRQLETAAHAVTRARHGGEGLAALSGKTFDLVITDILMPDVEGLEFIRSIRGRGLGLPIIAITGGAVRAGIVRDVDYLDVSLKLGATAMIRKPFSSRQLLSAVDDCLKSAQPIG